MHLEGYTGALSSSSRYFGNNIGRQIRRSCFSQDFVDPMRLLFWLPPSVATFIYTVFLKPKSVRAVAQWAVKKFIPSELTVDGLPLVMNREDAVVCGALALGCYETFPRQLFQKLLKPGMTVVDVGANIGLYTALAARGVGPNGRVVAVEPESHNCEFIRKTLARNQFTNVEVVQAGIGDQTGMAHLYINLENRADHRIFDKQATRSAVDVQLYRLDDLLAKLGITHVDMIKIDIQGAEALAVEGMLSTWQSNSDIRVMIEFWPWGILQSGHQPADLLRRIREQGFSIFEMDDKGLTLRPESSDAEMAGRILERQHMNFILQRSQSLPGSDAP